MGIVTRFVVTGGSVLALSAAAAGQTVVHFSDGSGLSAEARFELQNQGTTLRVTLRNTSTALPAGFGEADQLLTSLSWDFGVPGASAGDPAIVSGTVRTGPAAASMAFDVQPVGGDEDVSGEFGFTSTGAAPLLPDGISTLQSRGTGFGGPNLDGPTELAGPGAGLVPAAGPLLPIQGQGAIQGDVVLELDLSQPLSGLEFLADNGAMVEFGSDRAFLGELCDHDANTFVVPDPGGRNVPNGLDVKPGSRPTIGNPTFEVGVDDPANACGLAPGSLTQVFFSPAPASILWPATGCVPGTAGEIMIDLFAGPLTISGLLPWPGPGMPACHPFPIPSDPTLCRVVCYGQALFIDTTTFPSTRFALTNRLDFVIGL